MQLPGGFDKLAPMDYRKRPPIERADSDAVRAPEMWELIAAVDQLDAAYRQHPNLPAAMARRHLRILQRMCEQHGLPTNTATAPASARRAAPKAVKK